MTEKPGKAHHNNFGFFRLLFAYAVIVSHSPQMLDGNPAREPLMTLGLNANFGGLAVDGFFIISGYLIASSYLSSRSLWKFLKSRILRIYPAFLVACLICIFLVAPIGGGALGTLGLRDWLIGLGRTLLLMPPSVPNALHTLPIPALNGSMWTIRYEFRCYLLVALLGVIGLLDRRRIITALTVLVYGLAILVSLVGFPDIPPGRLHQFIFGGIGDPVQIFQLTAIFMSGVCARLYRDRFGLRPPFALLSAILLVGALFAASPIPELAVGTAGAYLLLWAAIGARSNFLQGINNSYDFSYGVYLYAWPIASLVILASQNYQFALPPLLLTAITAVLATLAACASWYGIEKPMLALKLGKSSALREAVS